MDTPSTKDDLLYIGSSDLKTMDDSRIIRLYLKTRNSTCFDILYKRYSGKIFSKCISLLKEEAKAKDATQEVFTKIFLNLAKFNEKSKFSTWVYSITYNYCIDYLRGKKKEKRLFSDEMENPPEIIDDVPDNELLEIEVSRLKVVLDKIPSGDKAILLMKYQDDLQIKEIARILDKTESAIKMKIKRAKHKAQRVYKEIFPELH